MKMKMQNEKLHHKPGSVYGGALMAQPGHIDSAKSLFVSCRCKSKAGAILSVVSPYLFGHSCPWTHAIYPSCLCIVSLVRPLQTDARHPCLTLAIMDAARPGIRDVLF